MSPKIFIDGAAGTTGLQIRSLLKDWEDAGKISIITLTDYKDEAQRKAAFAQADLSVLCLPDDAARDALRLAGPDARLIDASSAHRVDPDWTYGFPELTKHQPTRIARAQRVTNPGCFATGAISILRPLRDANVFSPRHPLTIIGVSGYTGGGKKMIEAYEAMDEETRLSHVFTAYSLNAPHKHIPEIKKYARLSRAPTFMPHVVNVPRGMMVSVALNNITPASAHKILTDAYAMPGSKVIVAPLDPASPRLNLSPFAALNKGAPGVIDTVTIHVKGWKTHTTLHALLDNLGKGAAAQALQNMGLMLRLKP